MLLITTAFVAILSVCLLIAFEIAVARTGSVQPLHLTEVDGAPTRISVVIPARNEEDDIEEALTSVLHQRGVDVQVIVVNDGSTDRTGGIVDRMAESNSRITVIHNPVLASGWLGKPNAMNHGVAAATADTILFTDADVIHAPTSFATGLRELRKRELDLLSFFPLTVCESFWENVCIPLPLVPFTVQFAMGADDPKSPNAWAAGAYILVRHDALREMGGIESVKSAIMDDAELARVAKRTGHRVGYQFAPQLMRVRLFKGNAQAFWGPTKNAIALTFSKAWMALPTILVPFIFFWIPILAMLVGVWHEDFRLFIVGLLQPLIGVISLVRVRFLCKFKWHKAVFFPLIAIPIACVLARSFYEQNLRGTLIWRGRAIDLAEISN